MLIASLVAGPAIYLLNFVSFPWTISAVLLVMGACQYVGMPISEAYIISHSPERNRSTILGIYYFLSRGGPGVIMPLIGTLIDHFGYYTSFNAVGIAMAAVTVGCFLFLRGSRD